MARQFILPTTPVAGYDPSTVFDENNNPLSREQYLAAGGAADGSNIQRLPTLNSRTGTSSTPQQVDPIEQFNRNLMEMLTRAQGMGNNTKLMAQKGKLQNEQVVNSMKPADQLGIQGLSPQGMMNARQSEAGLYDPEVKSLNDRMQLNNEAVSKFSQALDNARQLGETYTKYLKPDQATIDGVIAQMEQGFIPSDAMLEKVGKYLPNDIWSKAASAKKKASASGSSGGPTRTEIKDAVQTTAENKIDDILYSQRGQKDSYVSPQAWFQAREAWKAEGYTAIDFDKKFKNYTNPADPQDYGLL